MAYKIDTRFFAIKTKRYSYKYKLTRQNLQHTRKYEAMIRRIRILKAKAKKLRKLL